MAADSAGSKGRLAFRATRVEKDGMHVRIGGANYVLIGCRKGCPMRRWGVVISVVYALILLGFLYPLAILLGGENGLLSARYYQDVLGGLGEPLIWIPVAMLIVGQVVLLFLPVDPGERRLKPRRPVVRTAVIASMLLMIMSFAMITCLGVAIEKDNFFDRLDHNVWVWLVAGLWVGWGIVFYRYLRSKADITQRVVTWLLRGSVLELLIAVPTHVIVRRRGDCCAPVASSFGITTGIAIMLLSFGPSVLLLYKKRIEERLAAQHVRVP